METEIIVAIITILGGITVALIQQSRKENKIDHNIVATMIKDVHKDVVKVEDKLEHVEVKLDDHIKEHKTIPVIKPVVTKRK